jgi:hypothetical protein
VKIAFKMTERRMKRIRLVRERREYAAAMGKLRRVLGVGFALVAVVVFLLVVVL